MKKWQIVTLVSFAILDLIVLGTGFALVVIPTVLATPVAVIPTQTIVPPPSPTLAPLPTSIPIPSDTPVLPTLTPVVIRQGYVQTPAPAIQDQDSDAIYMQDFLKCSGYYDLFAKMSTDLSTAIDNGTIYNTEFCTKFAVIGSATLDSAYSCTDRTHFPDDADLFQSRSSCLSGLKFYRWAWDMLLFGCSSGTFDSRIVPFMKQGSTEINNATNAFLRYKNRHP